MPHPMSTPTAAGMIAPTVGITLPTVAPLPRCASGIRARCGRTKGIDAVRSACARVWSSRIEAKLTSLDTQTSLPALAIEKPDVLAPAGGVRHGQSGGLRLLCRAGSGGGRVME